MDDSSNRDIYFFASALVSILIAWGIPIFFSSPGYIGDAPLVVACVWALFLTPLQSLAAGLFLGVLFHDRSFFTVSVFLAVLLPFATSLWYRILPGARAWFRILVSLFLALLIWYVAMFFIDHIVFSPAQAAAALFFDFLLAAAASFVIGYFYDQSP